MMAPPLIFVEDEGPNPRRRIVSATRAGVDFCASIQVQILRGMPRAFVLES